MNITITDDEIEALRICQEWGVCEGSWAYKHLSELYDRIVEEQIKSIKNQDINEVNDIIDSYAKK